MGNKCSFDLVKTFPLINNTNYETNEGLVFNKFKTHNLKGSLGIHSFS